MNPTGKCVHAGKRPPTWGGLFCVLSFLRAIAPALAIISMMNAVTAAPSSTAAAEQVQVRKIWDAAPHNAFTDLARFDGKWFCTFREGRSHVSPEGAIRILTSTDGEQWQSAAHLTDPKADLRDPKLCITPEGRLMLTAAAALHQPAPAKHQTLAWYSSNGTDWGEPVKIGEPNFWLWRVTWNGGTGYSVGYGTGDRRSVRLYRTTDGRQFDVLVPNLFDREYPNETSLVFLPDETALCLLRRDGKREQSGMLGVAKPPYTDWTWKDLGVRIGGPVCIRLPDGRLPAVTRLYDGSVRTSLSWLDPQKGTLSELLKFPSGGDTSYAGMVWHNERLWISYYSSHEGKSSIYLARVVPHN